MKLYIWYMTTDNQLSVVDTSLLYQSGYDGVPTLKGCNLKLENQDISNSM